MSIQNLQAVVALCDRGYASYDPAYYEQIARLLETEPDTPEIGRMRGMCEAGPTLSSKRFAYPHIASDAKDLIASAEGSADTA